MPEVKEAILADTRLPYVETGKGAPVIFLHGALGDWRTWSPVLDAVAPHCRAIAVTQRHFGAAPRDHGAVPFGTQQQADDVVAFLDALNLPRAHVVAWSFSAHSALAAALQAPDRIASLCVYDLGFPTFVTAPADLEEIAAAGAAFAPIAAAAAARQWEAAAALLIDAAASEPGYFARQSPRTRAIHTENAHTVSLLFTQTPPVAISPAQLSALAAPATIAWGERSGVYRTVSRAAARCMPSARAREISAAGHLFPETDSHAFAALVHDHLSAAA